MNIEIANVTRKGPTKERMLNKYNRFNSIIIDHI